MAASLLWLYVTVGGLGAVSGLSVLLASKRRLTTRIVVSTVLGGSLTSVMVVAAWYGDASANPWPAIAASIAIGMAQPRGFDAVALVLSRIQIRVDKDDNSHS
jgi:hypothetical protein